MSYAVKEIFYTLQGEGRNAGRAAVFCRFAGCNLWTGREVDRPKATCQFCDTDFVGTDGTGGGRFPDAATLAKAVSSHWPSGAGGDPFVVLTGGEPLLQVDASLVDALHGVGLEIAVETNGTIVPPVGIDWLCVSPKAGAALAVTRGDELKLVFPQVGAEPERFEHLGFHHLLLQPMDGIDQEANVRAATAFCLTHPKWRLTLQTHKMLGIR
ncbi:7-carboxy-7-deazaguanine synthase [Lichenihabitans sp. Uapishka_5]|uniref:7-carboxy-7-deazaguanine synthase n=1 Tax=Lichenihabitans sp. Uapishka_5 TaxID=3037302 RepID=UPI0029E7D29A|nr:7-carboxy-7-deazaguanine synthase [Lichenihabitans sp. Uapishka_5]MDX7953241.1 7-carboxy-7-deazaguanine synthase [Lichenihabitans sp. Uapishka_5]